MLSVPVAASAIRRRCGAASQDLAREPDLVEQHDLGLFEALGRAAASEVAIVERAASGQHVARRFETFRSELRDGFVIEEYGAHHALEYAALKEFRGPAPRHEYLRRQGLIAANVIVFAVSTLRGERPRDCSRSGRCSRYRRASLCFHLWQIVTYAFLHDPPQLFAHRCSTCSGFSCSAPRSSAMWGRVRLLACYFASVVTAAFTQLFVPPLLGAPLGPTLGASGGVFGLLLAYALMFPHRKVVPLFPPIPMPAWLFATLYAGVELLARRHRHARGHRAFRAPRRHDRQRDRGHRRGGGPVPWTTNRIG